MQGVKALCAAGRAVAMIPFFAKSICLEFPGAKRNRTSREREELEAQCVVSY
jgi:hypothetical protein